MRNHDAQDYHAGSRCPRFTFFLATQSMPFEKERELALKSFNLGVVAMTTGHTRKAYEYFAEACQKWNNINKDGYKEIRETYISDYFNAAMALFQMTRIYHKPEDWSTANECLRDACTMFSAYGRELEESDKVYLTLIKQQTFALRELCEEFSPFGDEFSLDDGSDEERLSASFSFEGQSFFYQNNHFSSEQLTETLQSEEAGSPSTDLKSEREEDDNTLQQSPGKRPGNS